MALLAILAHGETATNGNRKKAVAAALGWIRALQDDSGHIHLPYPATEALDHALATMTLSEAIGMGEEDPSGSAQRAVGDLLKNPERWVSDPETAAWTLMALKSAKCAELQVPDEPFHVILASLEARDRHEPRTAQVNAMNSMSRFLCGKTSSSFDLPLLLASLQEPRGPDLQAVYFSTLACFHTGGEDWKTWSVTLGKTLRARQAPDGSMSPMGDLPVLYGGKAYSTALAALNLEVLYRYKKGMGIQDP